VRDSTALAGSGAYPLLLFGGEITVDHNHGGKGLAKSKSKHAKVTVGDFGLAFETEPEVGVLFKRLRSELDSLLLDKIEDPDANVLGGGEAAGASADGSKHEGQSSKAKGLIVVDAVYRLVESSPGS
jgi:hypothetical protein